MSEPAGKTPAPVASLYREEAFFAPGRDVTVIFHEHCVGGAGAAWAARFGISNRKREPADACIDFDLIPMNYQQGGDWRMPERLIDRCRGRAIYVVDFCPPRAILAEFEAVADCVVVIDHHPTARRHLEAWAEVADRAWSVRHWDPERRIGYVHDTAFSGAELAWMALAATEEQAATMPPSILLIGDRDTWRFRHEDTQDMHAYLSFTLEAHGLQRLLGVLDDLWADWVVPPGGGGEWSEALCIGEILRKDAMMMVETIASAAHFYQSPKWGKIWYVCCPKRYASDVGHHLAERNRSAYSITWWDEGSRRTYSLRSAETGADVGEIAARLGGGGHKHAAGFLTYRRQDSELPYIIDGVVE